MSHNWVLDVLAWDERSRCPGHLLSHKKPPGHPSLKHAKPAFAGSQEQRYISAWISTDTSLLTPSCCRGTLFLYHQLLLHWATRFLLHSLQLLHLLSHLAAQDISAGSWRNANLFIRCTRMARDRRSRRSECARLLHLTTKLVPVAVEKKETKVPEDKSMSSVILKDRQVCRSKTA